MQSVEEKNYESKCVEPKGQTVADEIMQRLQSLTGRAEKTSCWVEDKLMSVSRLENPPPEAVEETKQQEYPPLFAEMRQMIKNIERSFSRIENVLERTEL